MRVFIMAVGLIVIGTPAVACGPDSDCLIGERTYRIQLPQAANPDTLIGAIIFAHGYRGTAAGIMHNESLKQTAADLGVALVAAKSAVDDWSIPGAPSHVTDASVDELAYFDALIADITNRFPISENRLLVTGFSAGGMMVWNLACYRGERFAGFVPIAGTFWAPLPDACPSDPVNLFHIHGTSDSIVPLSGRAIEDAHQGDVHKALALLARQGRFGDAERLSHDELSCERRVNPAGRVLEFCTHPGGHSFSAGYIRRAWQALQARGAL